MKNIFNLNLIRRAFAGCNTNSDMVKLKLPYGPDANYPVHKAMERLKELSKNRT